MIFLKSIVRKKNWLGFLITFFFIILSLMVFNSLYTKLVLVQNETYQNILYRTISFDGIVKINLNEDIEKILNEDGKTIVIVKEYNKVKDVLNKIDSHVNYSINVPNENNTILFSCIKIAIYILFLFITVILYLYITDFIKEDGEMFKMLRALGYRKITIIKKYLQAFIVRL